jgi:hypothetical protein
MLVGTALLFVVPPGGPPALRPGCGLGPPGPPAGDVQQGQDMQGGVSTLASTSCFFLLNYYVSNLGEQADGRCGCSGLWHTYPLPCVQAPPSLGFIYTDSLPCV